MKANLDYYDPWNHSVILIILIIKIIFTRQIIIKKLPTSGEQTCCSTANIFQIFTLRHCLCSGILKRQIFKIVFIFFFKNRLHRVFVLVFYTIFIEYIFFFWNIFFLDNIIFWILFIGIVIIFFCLKLIIKYWEIIF